MKIASAVAFALVSLLTGPAAWGGASSGATSPSSSSADIQGRDDHPAARDLALASLASSAVVVDEWDGVRDERLPRGPSRGLAKAGGNTVRGRSGGGGGGGRGGGDHSSRSLACVPRFTDQYGIGAGAEMGIGPIGADKKLLATVPPGRVMPPTFLWYSPDDLTKPFYICNRQYQLLFRGMVGYTFRAFTNAVASGSCSVNGTDFYVLLKIYDVTNKKVVHRQKEVNAPYVLYGNEWPILDYNTNNTKYGSKLLPNGVYQVSATLHLPNATVVDRTSFGTDIYVVSC